MEKRAKKLGVDTAAIPQEREAREVAEKAEKERIAKEKQAAEEKARLEKEAAEERERKDALEKHIKNQRDSVKDGEEKIHRKAVSFGTNAIDAYRKKQRLQFWDNIVNVFSNVKEDNGQGSASNTIDAYRKRQQRGPVIVWLAIVLSVVVGIAFFVIWLTNNGDLFGLPSALGVGSTMVSEKDDMSMVYVPAGIFQMGSESGDIYEAPIHSVDLGNYWIDQFEVTNAMYAKCVESGVCNAPNIKKSYSHNQYYEHIEFSDYPVIYVSWYDANDYCSWAERRLPTEAEWEKAAGWDANTQNSRLYPWGSTIDSFYANYNDNVGDVIAVGAYEKGRSFYGAYDMGGNVWEWTSSMLKRYPYENEKI